MDDRKKKVTAEKIVLLGVLATGWFVLLCIIWLMFGPVKVMTVNTPEPIPVENKVVLPGERLEYYLDYCKYTPARATVYRALVDGQVITLQPTLGGLPEGCHKTLISTTVIPQTLNPGEYYLDVYLEYPVNFIRKESVHYRTEYFRVGELPRSDQEIEIIEREGQTIYVPYPVHSDEEEGLPPDPAPKPAVINIENNNSDDDQENTSDRRSSGATQPDPRDENGNDGGIIGGIRSIIGL